LHHAGQHLLVDSDRPGLGVGSVLSLGNGLLDRGRNLLCLGSDLCLILSYGLDVRHESGLDIGMVECSRLVVGMSIGPNLCLGDGLLFLLFLLLLLVVFVVIGRFVILVLVVFVVIGRFIILCGCFVVLVLVVLVVIGRFVILGGLFVVLVFVVLVVIGRFVILGGCFVVLVLAISANRSRREF
jgi:hypothetical protein